MIWNDPQGNKGILQEILDGLQQPKQDTGRWKFSDLLRRANIYMRKIAEESECLKIINTSNTSISGTFTYSTPGGCSRISRVAYGNQRLYGINQAELDGVSNSTSTWQNDTSPCSRYIDFSKYTPPSIRIWPTPQNSGTVITMECVMQPTEMVNDTDVPFNGNPNFYSFHDLIAKGVVYLCLLEQERPFYMEWKAQYEKGMQDLKDFVRKMPDTMMSTLIVGSGSQGRNISPLPGYKGF